MSHEGVTRHAMARVAALAAFAAFASSLLAVLVTPWCTRDRVKDPTAWVDAVAQSGGLIRAGDVVLVHPPWRDDIADALHATGALPRGARATVALSPRHGEALPPVVVVTDGSAPLPVVLAELLDGDDRDHGAVFARGGVSLTRLRARSGSSQARSILDALRGARVELRLDAGESDVIPCPWDALAERHVCVDQPEWQYVGMTDLPVGGKRVPCAWVHPKTGATLSVRFDDVHIGASERALVLSLGLSDGAADNRSGAPVDAVLLVDDREAKRVSKRSGARGFVTATAPISAGVHDVEVRVTTPNDGQRHACIQLDATAGAP